MHCANGRGLACAMTTANVSIHSIARTPGGVDDEGEQERTYRRVHVGCHGTKWWSAMGKLQTSGCLLALDSARIVEKESWHAGVS